MWWRLNFLISDFLTVNQKWSGWITNGSVINRSVAYSRALNWICNHSLLADCGTCLNFQRLLQKAHIIFYNTIGLCEYKDVFWSGVLNGMEQVVCLCRLLDLEVQYSPLLLVCGSLIHRFKEHWIENIWEKCSRKFKKAKLEFSVQRQNLHSIYIVCTTTCIAFTLH